ncbi:ester cyclase [uncultured Kriegella sp.]|uniref:nuclear transport factor 2 family protein n=1 Tax=uncultured Kriegella sp. TaxID=1798910 RepID=UPI0030DCF5E1|tara:strand:+ start:297463 stop:298218 length:756 start_codon:yes stop_codon:yes gene_type:complete
MEQHRNKQIVIDFYKKVIGEQDLDYAEKSVTDNYIQHNPLVRTGKAGFLEAITFLKQLPKPKKPSKPLMRIITENDHVAVHLNVEFGGQKKIVLEVFRLENGLIAEHWDAIQNQSEVSLNGNSEIAGPVLIEDEAETIQNKKIIEEFTELVLIAKAFDLLKKFVSPTVIQHNPEIATGRDGFSTYYQKVDIRKLYKVIGQGNFVVTQSKGVLNNKNVVYYAIYRLKNGFIREHWSVSQQIPEVMVHNNGMI